MGKKLEMLRNLLYEVDSKKETVFSEGPAPLTQEEKRAFAETVNRYSEIVESMISKRKLQEMMQEVEKMVEVGSRYIAESDGDVTDKVSESRRMRYVEAACNEAKKACNEILIAERRLEAALSDIGEGFNKYF